MLKNKILFKMTGSIAAYKACYLISKLVQSNYEVQIVASPSVFNFVGQATLEGLSQRPVLSDTFAPGNVMDHIHQIRWADAVIVCPATANFINKISQGVGDDLLTTLFLAHDFKKPYLLAPAMNTTMYQHPITQKSLNTLKSFGVQILETASGVLACGEQGWGKLLDPELIFAELESSLKVATPQTEVQHTTFQSTHSPKKVLITSGGTQEPIDSVRVLSNTSTGSTGAFLADQLISCGYEVIYVHAKNSVLPEYECKKISFTSFNDLNEILKSELNENIYDFVIHCAAVGDYSVDKVLMDHHVFSELSNKKIPTQQHLTIELKANFKIIDKIKGYSRNPWTKLIAFKLTSHATNFEQQKAVIDLIDHSKADMVVHNDMANIDKENSQHKFTLYHSGSPIVCESKLELATKLAELMFNSPQGQLIAEDKSL